MHRSDTARGAVQGGGGIDTGNLNAYSRGGETSRSGAVTASETWRTPKKNMFSIGRVHDRNTGKNDSSIFNRKSEKGPA